jgi:transcriptional regulator with XRE-family HTH domain
MTLGKRLQRARRKSGATLEEQANYLGVSTRTLIRWEQDEYVPESGHLVKVFSYLQRFEPNLTLAELLRVPAPSEAVKYMSAALHIPGYASVCTPGAYFCAAPDCGRPWPCPETPQCPGCLDAVEGPGFDAGHTSGCTSRGCDEHIYCTQNCYVGANERAAERAAEKG